MVASCGRAKWEGQAVMKSWQARGFVRRSSVLGALAALVLVSGCGGGDDDDENGSASGAAGMVTEAWSSYCVATFTAAHGVSDGFDTLFTAKPGERYLMSEFGEDFGQDRAELLYLTKAGPLELELDSATGPQGFPFTSNCEFGKGVPYYAVFSDVSVYSDQAMTTKVCDLSAGTALPIESGKPTGYSSVSFEFGGPNTFELYLNAFSAQCGGGERGYISVPQIEVFGTITWLVPVTRIIGPN
jgi:hypothetical protein